MFKQKTQKKRGFTRLVDFGNAPTRVGAPFRVLPKLTTGFSLLELLIYVTILSILVVVISNTFISLSKGRGQSEARSEVDSAMRFATEILKQDIKNASVITTPDSRASSSSLTLTRGGVTIIYDTSGGILRRKEGAAAPANLTNSNVSVGTPTFTRIENTNPVFDTTGVVIKIDMTFSYNSASPDFSYSTSLQTAVGVH